MGQGCARASRHSVKNPPTFDEPKLDHVLVGATPQVVPRTEEGNRKNPTCASGDATRAKYHALPKASADSISGRQNTSRSTLLDMEDGGKEFESMSEADSTMNERFPYGMSVCADDVIRIVQQMGESEMFQTQEYLFDMLSNRRDEDFVCPIRESVPYANLLRMLRMYNDVAGIFGKTDEFEQVGAVDIDYDAIGISNTTGCDPRIPIYWKKVGVSTSIRFSVEVPLTNHAGHLIPCGYATMWDELDLWPTWHPVAAASGPTLCIGGEQEQRSEYGASGMRLLDGKDNVLGILHVSQLLWHYKFFPPNSACFVDAIHVITDDELLDDASSRALLKQFPAPKCYTRKTDLADIVTVCVVQKETALFAVGFNMHVPRFTPRFLLCWLLKTFIPGIVSNMFKSVGNNLRPGSAYYPRLQEDRKGLYARVNELRDIGKAQEEARGYRFDQNHLPSETWCSLGPKNLVNLDDDLAREFCPPPRASSL